MANKLFYNDKPIIGLEIDQTTMKVMAINPKKMLVEGYGSLRIDPAKSQKSFENNDEYLGDSLKELLTKNLVGNLPSNHALISLPTNRTFTRTFVIPRSVESHLREAVETEVDQYIPVPMAALYIDYQVIEHTKEDAVVLLSAVPKKMVDACMSALEEAGLRATAAVPSISAVARLLEKTEEGHLPTVIVDIGPANTDIAILDQYVRLTGSIATGGNSLTLAISKKMGVSLENAHQLKVLNGLNAGPRQSKIRSSIKPELDKIVSEVRKIMRYYNERIANDANKLEQLLIVGAGANVPGIGEFFTNELLMPARVASPWQVLDFGKLEKPSKQLRSHYITVAGLAAIPPEEIWR